MGTFPDITLVSENIAHRVKSWKVLKTFTGTDNDYITFSLKELYLTDKRNMFLRTMQQTIYSDNNATADARSIVTNTIQIIKEACNASKKKLEQNGKRTQFIGAKRKLQS